MENNKIGDAVFGLSMNLFHDPCVVLSQLVKGAHFKLASLPSTHGLYGLRDHMGEIRYIGITQSPTMGFRRRINNYHAGGDEIHSQKFSRAYCTGRMWRDKSLLGKSVSGVIQKECHAKRAKALRRHFIRLYCSASFVEIDRGSVSGDYFSYLKVLEAAVKSLAPQSMKQWDGHGFPPVEEPIELVDRAIAEGNFSTSDIVAFEEQRMIYARISK